VGSYTWQVQGQLVGLTLAAGSAQGNLNAPGAPIVGEGRLQSNFPIAGPAPACGVGCGTAGGATVMAHHWEGTGGDYKMKTYYEYVGPQQGEFSAVRVPSNVHGHCGAIIVSICLFLPVLLLLLHAFSSAGVSPTPAPPPVVTMPPPSPATPAPTPPPITATCTWWGDPHYWVFDDPQHTEEEDEYANHDYWVIKTPNVWVQGRYRPTEWLKARGNHRACMAGICFGGPFMQDNVFCVMALNRAIYYNKLKVLASHGTFTQGPVRATYSEAGTPMDPRMGGGKMQLNIVKINLPRGVTVQVDRWKEHVDGQITMNSVEAHDGIEGHCGNFNGNVKDDVNTQLSSFQEHNSMHSKRVTESECLFPTHPHFHDPLSGKLEPGSTFAKETLSSR